MKRFLVPVLLCVLCACGLAQGSMPSGQAEIRIPLRFETLGDDTTSPQIGKSIAVTDLGQADQQMSSVLLQGLQNLGLQIELPKLDPQNWIKQDQEWRSNRLQIDTAWVRGHNDFAASTPIPAGRIYAVQYIGRYHYAPHSLNVAMSVKLFEKSRLGPLRVVSFPYSGQYFANRLEQSIQSRLPSTPGAK